jgi:hypothetical protein
MISLARSPLASSHQVDTGWWKKMMLYQKLEQPT